MTDYKSNDIDIDERYLNNTCWDYTDGRPIELEIDRKTNELVIRGHNRDEELARENLEDWEMIRRDLRVLEDGVVEDPVGHVEEILYNWMSSGEGTLEDSYAIQQVYIREAETDEERRGG